MRSDTLVSAQLTRHLPLSTFRRRVASGSTMPKTGKRLVFLTNNYVLPDLTITELYAADGTAFRGSIRPQRRRLPDGFTGPNIPANMPGCCPTFEQGQATGVQVVPPLPSRHFARA